LRYSVEDIDAIEDWWIKKSRVNFLAYRTFLRPGQFVHNWFIADLCVNLQQFYADLIAGKRPILLIQSPPQHGKSWSITDFIAWVSGREPQLRSIYASYSDTLGIRCNAQLQRFFDSDKHRRIFLDHRIGGTVRRNSRLIEYVDANGSPTGGQFRNTTVAGAVTGETLDLGVIDDAVKGREQAGSLVWSQKIWEWFTDDFMTRFSDRAGLLVIMTRWTTHDLIARLLDIKDRLPDNFKLLNYQAIATKGESNRDEGEALFPKLKSLSFLEGKKAVMPQSSWESLYQGNPTVSGGNKFKDEWWQWWKILPPLAYKFITADTAQKTKNENDWTVFQCWGFGIDGRLYLLNKFREKLEAPDLRREAEIFYKKHDTPRLNANDPVLRGMYIEDKSSGVGLLQELKRKRMKVIEVPRITDKIFRAEDASPYIKAGLVVLNTDIPGADNITKEAREFPNSEFDDDIDTLMTAIEVAFINKDKTSMLAAAMEVD